ncbi:unnamed protein product [Adineta steineri]|uniref:CRAL-TRIO domain-containing protein n=1 Tax=Adineta steineri TaxID=433720 RepID=A0A815MRI2_9BILA|nr:unnamed protein product [Adineta steineri]CAF1426477.1 unnamed protein product [Adineta steineri]
MAAPIPTYQTLTTVEAFRKAVNEHFAKQINEGQEYDERDIKRFNEIDEYALMFVRHAQYGKTFDEQKGFYHFNEAMTWRKQNNAYDISTDRFPSSYFDRHAVFYKNHDVNNSRVLNCIIRVFHKGQEDNEAVKRFIIYNFEEQIRSNPGQRIAILFDMRETGLGHLDYDLIKFIINSLMYHYPGLLSYMLIFKLPFILQAAWKLIKSWLPTETQNSVIFANEKTITNYIPADQLPKAMGGTRDEEL